MAAQKKAARKTAKKMGKKPQLAYRRILLKLSGESLQGPQGFGIHGETIQAIAQELKEVQALGVEIAIMVGGGNIFRGGRQKGFEIDRATGDTAAITAGSLSVSRTARAMSPSCSRETSTFVTRPAAPDGGTRRRSTPRSRASLRVAGVASTGPSARARAAGDSGAVPRTASPRAAPLAAGARRAAGATAAAAGEAAGF